MKLENSTIEITLREERALYESAIKQLTKILGTFIGQCLAEDGTIKAATKQAIYYTRKCLPVWCKIHWCKRKYAQET